VTNAMMIIFEEVQNETECRKFISDFEEISIYKLYVKRESNHKKNLIHCIQNTTQIEKIISTLKNYYENKIDEIKAIEFEEGDSDYDEIEEDEIKQNQKKRVINDKIYSDSVILTVDDFSRLSLRDEDMKVKIILSNFRRMIHEFPKIQSILCPKLMETIQEKDSGLVIINNRSLFIHSKLEYYGRDDNLNQYNIEVSNHYYKKIQNNFDRYSEEFQNRHKGNILKKYLSGKEYLKTHPSDIESFFTLSLEGNELYSSYVLEDILIPQLIENKPKTRILIPLIVELDIESQESRMTDDGIQIGGVEQDKIYYMCYLFYDKKRIYLYPLYLFYKDENVDLLRDRKMENIKKVLLNKLCRYLQQMIESSVLYTLLKIQFGGMIHYDISTLENINIPSNIQDFLIVYFQLFYSLINPEEKPNEIIHIFPTIDIHDHYYIFLQFFQEICK